MKAKRIAMMILAVAVVASGTTAVYASKKSDVATKNVVVTAQRISISTNVNTENKEMTDEQAVQIATKAMKDYMGLDVNYFSKINVITRDKATVNGQITDQEKQQLIATQKCFIKVHPELASKSQEMLNNAINDEIHRHEIITVDFTPASEVSGGDFVDVDAVTGKIINVTATNNLETYAKGKADEAKVKEAAINFMKKIGQDGDVDFSKITIDNNGPLSVVNIALKDQSSRFKGTSTIGLEVSSQGYTVMHYENYDEAYDK